MNEAQKYIAFEMTKEDFAKLPKLGVDDYEGFDPMKDTFESLVVIPTGELHDSGFGCMEFALLNDIGEPICRVNGIADVICIDGIGGYGVRNIFKAHRLIDGTPVVRPHGWKIDCLPCGYLRLFCGARLMLERPYWTSSTFEIYAEENKQ